MPESRLLKYNEENLARQKALVDATKAEAEAAAQAAAAAHADASPARGAGRKGTPNAGGRGTKRSRESTDQDELERRPEIKLTIPDVLKVQLVDDWENITRKEQLVPLPRNPNVREILKEYGDVYRATHKGKQGDWPAVLDEVLAGIKLYFDKSLAQNLLYRFERPQYVEMRKQHGPKMGDGDVDAAGHTDAKPKRGRQSAAAAAPTEPTLELEASEIYGAEHLLRLFGTSRYLYSQPPWHRRAHEHGLGLGRGAARAPHRVPRVYGARAEAPLCGRVRHPQLRLPAPGHFVEFGRALGRNPRCARAGAWVEVGFGHGARDERTAGCEPAADSGDG